MKRKRNDENVAENMENNPKIHCTFVSQHVQSILGKNNFDKLKLKSRNSV